MIDNKHTMIVTRMLDDHRHFSVRVRSLNLLQSVTTVQVGILIVFMTTVLLQKVRHTHVSVM